MVWPFEEVIVVRHGETEWNVAGRRQGQLDSPLTQRGREQVLTMASAVAALGPDAVFSSPLGRTRATSTPIAAAVGRPVQILDELGEIDHGEFAGLTAVEIEERWPGALTRREQDKYEWSFPGGESYRDAAARAATALDIVAARSARRPLIVAHEMLGRVLVGHLLELSPEDALRWSLPHGTVLRLEPGPG